MNPKPVIALCVCGSLLLPLAGCSSTGFNARDAVAAAGPELYRVPGDSLSSLDTDTKVIVVLKNTSAVNGWFEGIETVGARRVVMVWPHHLPEVADSLERWVPIQGEPIVVYKYPSYEVYMEGQTDLEMWTNALKNPKRTVHYLTPQSGHLPKNNVCIRYMPQHGTYTRVAQIPMEKIEQIYIDPKQPIGKAAQAANALFVLAAGAVIITGAFFLTAGL